MRLSGGWNGIRWNMVAIALIVAMTASCSGLQPYESTLPANLNVSVKVVRGGVLSVSAPGISSFSVDMHVIAVSPRCEKTYRGGVEISSAPVKVGIPVGSSTLLAFEFSGHNFLTRGSGSSSWASLLTPRGGYQYDIDVSYNGGMYSVEMYERNPGNGQRRALDYRSFRSCVPSAEKAGTP